MLVEGIPTVFSWDTIQQYDGSRNFFINSDLIQQLVGWSTMQLICTVYKSSRFLKIRKLNSKGELNLFLRRSPSYEHGRSCHCKYICCSQLCQRAQNNTLFVAPSHGLFLTCRREKYTVLKQYCTEHIVNERVPHAKIFTWGSGLWQWMQIPFRSGPMLQDDCLILCSVGSTSLLAHPLAHHLDHTPLILRNIHICDKQFLYGKQRRHRYIETVLGSIYLCL